MKHELIIAVVNRGFSELVIYSARTAGAKGGTILTARGTGTQEVRKLFGISADPDKELVMILSSYAERNQIMTAICKATGLNTLGRGIVFSIPVDNVLGISLGINDEKGQIPDGKK